MIGWGLSGVARCGIQRGVNLSRIFESLPEGALRVLSVLMWLLALYLAIAWIVLPVYVIKRLTEIRDLLTEIRDKPARAEPTAEEYRQRALGTPPRTPAGKG